ncbi:hypothetical protein HDV63DRAFT_130517 [Trichoderma sp. SZMC 28014]
MTRPDLIACEVRVRVLVNSVLTLSLTPPGSRACLDAANSLPTASGALRAGTNRHRLVASRYPPHYKSIATWTFAGASPCLATHTPSAGATATAPYSPADRALDVQRGSMQTKGEIQYCRHVQQRHHITVESQATAHARINSADTKLRVVLHRPGRGRFVYHESIRAPTPTALPPEEKHSAASSMHSALLNTPILPESSCAAGFISQCDRPLDHDICLKIYPPKKARWLKIVSYVGHGEPSWCVVCWFIQYCESVATSRGLEHKSRAETTKSTMSCGSSARTCTSASCFSLRQAEVTLQGSPDRKVQGSHDRVFGALKR